MLSRCRLLLDGESPLLLTSRAVDYFSATHYLRQRAVTADSRRHAFGRPRAIRRLERHRAPHAQQREHVGAVVRRRTRARRRLRGHISVKAQPSPLATRARPTTTGRPGLRVHRWRDVRAEDDEGYRTTIGFSQSPSHPSGVRFGVTLAADAGWELIFESASARGCDRAALSDRTFGTEPQHVRESLGAEASRPAARDAGTRPATHLRALDRRPRLAAPEGQRGAGRAPGGGHALVHDALRARHADHLAADAGLRARAGDRYTARPGRAPGRPRTIRRIDAEPGKILHELRRGQAATSWFPIYYGSIDATPLFLVLLSEVWRWTGDAAIVRSSSRRCGPRSRGSTSYGDRDGDGFVEYERRAPHGLRINPGRTPATRIASATAGSPDAHRACRGAGLRLRRARSGSPARRPASGRSRSRESACGRAPPPCGNASTRPSGSRTRDVCARARRRQATVDSLCSNLGHLLWSGIVPANRDRQRRRLHSQARALDRLGRAHDGRGRGGLQPAELPQRHRVATRHGARRVGTRSRPATPISPSSSASA